MQMNQIERDMQIMSNLGFEMLCWYFFSNFHVNAKLKENSKNSVIYSKIS